MFAIAESFPILLDLHTHTRHIRPSQFIFPQSCYTEWVKCQLLREAKNIILKCFVLLRNPVHCTDCLLFATVKPMPQVSLHLWSMTSPSSPVNLLHLNYSWQPRTTGYSWRCTWAWADANRYKQPHWDESRPSTHSANKLLQLFEHSVKDSTSSFLPSEKNFSQDNNTYIQTIWKLLLNWNLRSHIENFITGHVHN